MKYNQDSFRFIQQTIKDVERHASMAEQERLDKEIMHYNEMDRLISEYEANFDVEPID